MCKDLIRISDDNEMVINSREIVEMVNMEHWKILRKLEGTEKDLGIIPVLADNDFVVGDYFIKTSYLDANNQQRPCYDFTKMGCELFANKLTGEKGIVFSAKYVNAFNSMEHYIRGEGNKVMPIDVANLIDEKIRELYDFYRPTHKQKLDICKYIKGRLGIATINDEYKLVQQRILIKLNANKWQDLNFKILQDNMELIDKCIDVVKADRKETKKQLSMFDKEDK